MSYRQPIGNAEETDKRPTESDGSIVATAAQFARDQANQKFEQLVEPFAKGVKAADIMNDARLAADLSQTNNRPGQAWVAGNS